jgi:hypothetical protein
MPLLLAGGGWAAELEVISGPGNAGELHWERLELNYRPEASGLSGRWHVQVDGLEMAGAGMLGSVALECRRGRMEATGPWCDDGSIRWTEGPLFAEFQSEFRLTGDQQGLELQLTGGPIRGQARLPRDPEALSLALEFDTLALDELPDALFADTGFRDLAGELSGSLGYVDGRLSGSLGFLGFGFDSIDGAMAGFGINADLTFTLEPGADRTAFKVELTQSAGEMLFGQIYLPPPQQPLELDVSGHHDVDGSLVLERLILLDPGAIRAELRLEMHREDEDWSLERLDLSELDLTFPLAWERWLDGPLAAMGLAGIETAGRLHGSLIHGEEVTSGRVSLQDFHIDDPQGRFGLDGVVVELILDNDDRSLVAAWDSLSLFGLPMGSSELRLAGQAGQTALVEPVRLPLLDGAVVIERLLWDHAEVGDRDLQLDARIEPLDLAELTKLLGFPEFGGVLSGSFPGVQYADEVLSFTGGIDIRAFSGRIELSDLAIERPFGTLPALAAQVEFHRLNLAEVTGAFNFGHMSGQLSGWMRDLRLLDWRPVAMDTRVFTHEDVPRRRVSQRAVDNLSNLGGAGGALISGTVLRIFDDFPYRRAGLACRLSNNICYIDGVALHESGGFYIIQGRSLPRLDIIGHRRLVDWPQLMTQLEAMLED